MSRSPYGMSRPVRLSPVTLVHVPTQRVELYDDIFASSNSVWTRTLKKILKENSWVLGDSAS